MSTVSKIILASNSPRRQQLMRDSGYNFEVKSMNVPEDYPSDMSLYKVPAYLAQLKASALKPMLGPGEIVIGADTVVIINQGILGKPRDRKEAVEMLQTLSGRKHEVVTGVSLISLEKEIIFSDLTEVYFRPLRLEDIEYYIDHYKPYDKAGSYGVQEWIGYMAIERINGSFYNVMGLPIHLVIEAIRTF